MKIAVRISEAQWRQAIKTGIAGCLAMFVANALKLPQGYWAAISAVIVMQSRLGAALGAGWSRMAGTAIGAAVAVPFTRIWGSNLLAFGVAVILTVLICSILQLEESYRLASATVAIVMLVSTAAPAWIVAVHRFIEVTLGIGASVLVTQFVWPSRAVEALRHGIADVLIESETLFRAAMARFRGEDSASLEPMQARIEQILGQNDVLQKHASYEWAVARGSAARLLILSERAELIFRLVESLCISAADTRNGSSYEPYEPELGQLAGDISTALDELARSLKEGRSNAAVPALKKDVVRLSDKISVTRKCQSTQTYSLEEVLRLYAVLLGLLRLGEQVDRTHRATRHNLKS